MFVIGKILNGIRNMHANSLAFVRAKSVESEFLKIELIVM